MEITPVKSNYAPVKSKISTSPSSSFVLSAETQRFAVTDSHPYAFSFSPTPSEYRLKLQKNGDEGNRTPVRNGMQQTSTSVGDFYLVLARKAAIT